MDDLITTLEVSTLVEFYVMFTLLCFVFKVTVGLQPSSGKKTNPSSLQAGFSVDVRQAQNIGDW